VPFADLTFTVMGVFNGMFAQLTTTGIGLACCAEMTASGVARIPVGEAETGMPPTPAMVTCVP
jgi:hypothetical protein